MGKADLTGKVFGRLTAIRDSGQRKRRGVVWECRCECGNTIFTTAKCLVSGDSKSCGCLHKEIVGNNSYKHGHARTKLYRMWAAIKSRCTSETNECYERYGGRGIKVCNEWMNFMPFHDWAIQNGYSDNLTIERKDPNGNYEPSNCEFVTLREQAYNKRNTYYVEYNGEKVSLAKLCFELGLRRDAVYHRLWSGWPLEKALSEPFERYNKKSS